MNENPLTCVWEVTMGCNMRCKHCGSSCEEALSDELTTQEAFKFIDQCAEVGLKWITLSGGEPLTRKDLPLLVKRLRDFNIAVNIITNGWCIDDSIIKSLKESNVSTIAISIDGPEEVHDKIRRAGSFARSREAFAKLKTAGINTGAITTISKQNIERLSELKEILISMGVSTWQVQIGLPMGNFSKRPEWLIEPEQVEEIIDFCYKTAKEGRIDIFPADCIGYYTKKESLVRQMGYHITNFPIWDGCNAGVRSFGILQNGDILGCTSIRSKDNKFIEGNIQERKLKDIWNDETKFLWRRNLRKKDLTGDCKICNYGAKCLGGCPNTRLTINKSIYSENNYCAYHLHLKQLKEDLKEEKDNQILYEKIKKYIKNKLYQETAFVINELQRREKVDNDTLKLLGFCEYMCGNYIECENANRKVLSTSLDDSYALKGLGIALHKQGKSEEAIKYLKKAAEITCYKDQDILNDLAIVSTESAMNLEVSISGEENH